MRRAAKIGFSRQDLLKPTLRILASSKDGLCVDELLPLIIREINLSDQAAAQRHKGSGELEVRWQLRWVLTMLSGIGAAAQNGRGKPYKITSKGISYSLDECLTAEDLSREYRHRLITQSDAILSTQDDGVIETARHKAVDLRSCARESVELTRDFIETRIRLLEDKKVSTHEYGYKLLKQCLSILSAPITVGSYKEVAGSGRPQTPIKLVPVRKANKIGEYVRNFFAALERTGNKLSDEDIQNGLDSTWSSETLGVWPALFASQEMIEGGAKFCDRYWNVPYNFGGKIIYITSEWYLKKRPRQKPAFDAWASKIAKKYGIDFTPYVLDGESNPSVCEHKIKVAKPDDSEIAKTTNGLVTIKITNPAMRSCKVKRN